MSTEFDVVIIGGGPGGYVAAIKAAQLGLKTACVEKRGTLGGTCLNVGCIPSKALLHTSHLYEEASEHFEKRGITAKGVSVDVKKMLSHKDETVLNLTRGIEGLFKKNKVTYFKGTGTLLGKGAIEVKGNDKGDDTTLNAKNIVIATGSSVTPLPGVEIDGKTIISSDHAISLPSVPKKLAVIGGGVIGLELGSVWRRLGAEVTVIEYLDKILPPMDNEVSKEFQKILTKQGIEFKLGTKVTGAKTTKKGATLTLEPSKGGKEETLDADVVLVAIGRKPYVDSLGLENVGVTRDKQGRIEVDAHFKAAEGVYAIGDVIAGPMLAHKAEEDGVAVAEIIAGQAGHVDYDLVPSVVYTYPEIAMIGKTEEQLKEAGVAYNKGKFPFMANSRARTMDETDGFVKILADKETDQVLGVHIIGPQAGTLIGEASVAMAYKAASEDIARICHSHPDLNEAIKEAALATFFKPIHM